MGIRGAFLSIAALIAVAAPANAAQLVLTPGNVIASSGSYTGGGTSDPGDFAADNIFDQQTGNVVDGHAYDSPPATYWLNGNGGPANAFITIDLGALYSLTSFDFFNTHNATYYDRGTGNFSLIGSTASNFATFTTLASGTLAATPDLGDAFDFAPIAAQNFTSASNAGVRYLQFRPTSVAAANGACCGSPSDRLTVYGLNELRIFGAAVPEPATWMMMLFGFGLIGSVARSRQSRARAAFA